MAEVNLNRAFREVFGIYSVVPYFPTATKQKAGNTFAADFPDAERETEFEEEFDFFRENMNGKLMQDRYEFGHESINDTYKLSPYTIMECSRAKNIVTTSLLSRNGTVKEFISMDDWVFTFRGFLINENENTLPTAQVRELVSIFEINQTLKFFSSQVYQWYSDRGFIEQGAEPVFIVVEELKLPPFDGADNVQPFEIICRSDNPIEIDIFELNA
jgi:hypothetical protein